MDKQKSWRHQLQPMSRFFVEVKFSGGDKPRLSITAVDGPRPNGNCSGSCGQCSGELLDFSRPSRAPFTDDDRKKLYDAWGQWHLNDMRAGCEHQRELATRPEISEPCVVCGYKYGHAWLYEALPNDVLEWLHGLPTSGGNPWSREYEPDGRIES